jgi:O-methyltransferase
MYESYMDCFYNLYDKLSIGGFVLIDDYPIGVTRRAVRDFRVMHNITEPLVLAQDGSGAYWRKEKHVDLKMQFHTDFRKADAAQS